MTVIRMAPIYRPNPRNGEVYACQSFACHYDGDAEIQCPDGYIVVHESRFGDSSGLLGHYETMDEARAAAGREAIRLQAVLA